MFTLPLILPAESAYKELGIDVESSPEEVREAKNEASQRVAKELAELKRELELVRAELPGLQPARERMRTISDSPSAFKPREIEQAQATLAAQELLAIKINDNFAQLETRISKLEQRLIDINGITIDGPEQRRIYDSQRPPLALLKVASTATDSFLESSSVLHLLRRDVAAFLEKRGEVVFHPSDLTRSDFTADFTPNPILDSL